MMLLIIIIGTSILCFCLGESTKMAISSVSFHREDVPLSYEYSSVHLYDTTKIKKDVNTKGNYQYQKHHKPYSNIQYAPLDLIEQENYKTFDTKLSIPTHIERSDISITEDSTNKNNIEPLEQYTDNRHRNRNAIPLQYVDGHNIRMEPLINQIVYKNEQKSGYGNFVFPDRNKYFPVKNNIHQSYPNIKSRQLQDLASVVRYTSITGITEPQQIYKALDPNHVEPIQSMQVLSSLDSAQIQPLFNQYYVKAPRLHLNVARSHKIAQKSYKEPESGNLIIHKSKSKQTFVPDVDVLIEQKRRLYPSKNIQ